MQKYSTLKILQDKLPAKIYKNGANLGPSEATIQYILAYAAALMVLKTKTGNFNVLLN